MFSWFFEQLMTSIHDFWDIPTQCVCPLFLSAARSTLFHNFNLYNVQKRKLWSVQRITYLVLVSLPSLTIGKWYDSYSNPSISFHSQFPPRTINYVHISERLLICQIQHAYKSHTKDIFSKPKNVTVKVVNYIIS